MGDAMPNDKEDSIPADGVELASHRYVAITIFPDHGEVIDRERENANDIFCRTSTHERAEMIAAALNAAGRANTVESAEPPTRSESEETA